MQLAPAAPRSMGEVCMWGKGVRSLFWLLARPVSCPGKAPARGEAAEGSPWSSWLRQPASVASCQFETKALRRRRDTRGGIKRAPRSLQPFPASAFRSGMAERGLGRQPRGASPRRVSLRVPPRKPPGSCRSSPCVRPPRGPRPSGRARGGGRAGEGAAGWGLRPPRRRVPGLSGQLDVTRQSQGGFVK